LIGREQYDPPAFRLSLLLKDVRLALAAADAGGASMPLADVVHDALLEAVANGDGERDTAALARVAMRRVRGSDESKKPAA
jgi:3-hydroxyisobutyrate dehydrogenase-like beta-hydroxyacid dehydrogenase